MNEYALRGPQVEPDAGYWMYCPRPCMVRIEDLLKLTDDPKNPRYFPPYPTDKATIKKEFEELIDLQGKRDDPCALVNPAGCATKNSPNVCSFDKGLPGDFDCRRPISKFLNLVPPALGAVVVPRLPGEQIIRTGRGMARAVESETPGLFHRHALNYLIRLRNWSPPRQALVWAILDVATASALQAAWYYKWLAAGRSNTARRERPIEYARREDPRLTVLFDRPDELNPAYNLCPDGRPHNGKWPDNDSGTPRHPAYPSGHSTYAGAASEVLSFFFGTQKTPDDLPSDPRLGSVQGTSIKQELDYLADNIGLGRMWAGIHWRSDHEAGVKLGRVVACMVLEQVAQMGKVECTEKKGKWTPGKVTAFDLCTTQQADIDQCDFDKKAACPNDAPPPREKLECEAEAIRAACSTTKELEDPCKAPPEPKDGVKSQFDRGRGVQQSSK